MEITTLANPQSLTVAPMNAPVLQKASLPSVPTNLLASTDVQKRVAAALAELDTENQDSLVFWGAKELEGLAAISTQLIASAKARDSGPVGSAIADLTLRVRGFNVADIDQGSKAVGFIKRLFTKAIVPIEVAKARFETTDSQIDTIVATLDKHITTMTRGLVGLERMYAENVKGYEGVKIYIQAGKLALQELDNVRLPALKAAITDDDMMTTEAFARLDRFRQRLSRRVNDLLMAEQALYQGLVTTATMEDNNYNLIGRTQSTITTNVALWRQAVALALISRDTEAAADAQKDSADLGNELLVQNAKRLRITSGKVIEQVERGAFDISAIKEANDQLVGTLTDARTAYDAGEKRRAEDVIVMDQCSKDIRAAITASNAVK